MGRPRRAHCGDTRCPTFSDFAFERVAAGLPTPGVIEVPETVPRAVIIDELILIAGASEPGEWKDTVRYLPLR